MTQMIAMFLGAMLNNEKPTMSVFIGAAVLIFGLILYFYKDFKARQLLAKKIEN